MSSPSSDHFQPSKRPPLVVDSFSSTSKTVELDELPQRIFSSAADGFFEWRPYSNGFTFSPSFATMLGYVPGRLPLTVAAIAAHIYCDDYARSKLCLARAMLSGVDAVTSFRMVTQQAKCSWFQLQLRVLSRGDDGQIDSAIGCVSNVDHLVKDLESSRIQAENEQWLRQTVRHLLQQQDDQALDECLTNFCNRVNIDHVVLRQAYRSGERYRLVAKGFHDRNKETLDFTRVILREHMPFEFSQAEQGKPVLIQDFDEIESLSPTFKQRIDELQIKSLATLPIFYHGHIDYYLSLIMTSHPQPWDEHTVKLAEALGDALAQVAARRHISQNLEISEARFQNALEASQDGIWDWDLTNDKFFVTPTFLYMLGHDEELLPLDRGKISKLLQAPTTLNDFFVDQAGTKGHFDKAMPFRHRDGHTVLIWVRSKQTAWDEQGKATRCVGINIDIDRFKNRQIMENAVSLDSSVNNPCPSTGKKYRRPRSIDEALSSAKVLLAEDNPINQQVATGILKRKGVTVTIVNDGQEAVDMLNASPSDSFDMVLMDMEMPVLDGYAATKMLRENNKFNDLPIIALTAHARDEDKSTCLSLGMNDHVSKPVKPDLLYAAIARQLGCS